MYNKLIWIDQLVRLMKSSTFGLGLRIFVVVLCYTSLVEGG